MIVSIKKRDGRIVPFNKEKIEQAIAKSFMASSSQKSAETATELASLVVAQLDSDESIPAVPTVEQVQDEVERVLIEKGFVRSAKSYILYRAERSRVREMNTRLMKIFEDIAYKDAADSDIKRENANINGDTAMGSMLKFGSEGAKQFYDMYVLDPRYANAHREGDIHIHDLDFYTLTTTCCQIDLISLFHGGFSTGHGVLREPNDIYSYSALACIAIQANQNDQHGGQSVVNFDYGMAPGVHKTYGKRFRDNLARALELIGNLEDGTDTAKQMIAEMQEELQTAPTLRPNADYDKLLAQKLTALLSDQRPEEITRIVDFVREHAEKETDKATYQAMEALIHNLNTMNSRAGAQVPFSSINYGMDTSAEGRMVIRNLLLATEAG
ncbi:MAG: anaerobic ribonucleoside-triphosphate reductase, partial [Clostridia bacterium]